MKGSTTVPDPVLIDAKLQELGTGAAEFFDRYKWLHGMGLTPGVTVQMSAQRREEMKAKARERGRPDDEIHFRPDEDPTGETATSGTKRWIRARLVEAAALLDEALSKRREAELVLRSLDEKLDQTDEQEYETDEPARDTWLREGELEAAREAKRRREERGEGWGHG